MNNKTRKRVISSFAKCAAVLALCALLVACGGGGGGGGGGTAPASSDSLTGCWWVWTETSAYGVVKTELCFDNSNIREVAYLNDVLQVDAYCPYTLSGNTLTYNPSEFVLTYSVSGVRTHPATTASVDYSVSGNKLTLSNQTFDGVSAPIAIVNGSHSSIVLTRK
ncbi:MAG: hypothetical protein II973_07885 [Spirochaetaceae bacterium]|nr:hypothetical protein [Spirochaetaceae bacterium]